MADTGNTRNGTPIGAVMLNPERDVAVNLHNIPNGAALRRTVTVS